MPAGSKAWVLNDRKLDKNRDGWFLYVFSLNCSLNCKIFVNIVKKKKATIRRRGLQLDSKSHTEVHPGVR